jgi:hypothetical protein
MNWTCATSAGFVQMTSFMSSALMPPPQRDAALYCKQIDDGLDGDPQAALKARVILREMLGEVGGGEKPRAARDCTGGFAPDADPARAERKIAELLWLLRAGANVGEELRKLEEWKTGQEKGQQT